MSNVIFYHSVPDNTPGCLWFPNGQYNPLFPNRAVPRWLTNLLESDFMSNEAEANISSNNFAERQLPDIMVLIMGLLKKGVRRTNILAFRLGVECDIIEKYLTRLQDSGLIYPKRHLTKRGMDFLMSKPQKSMEYDWSIHIPRTWCTGQ